MAKIELQLGSTLVPDAGQGGEKTDFACRNRRQASAKNEQTKCQRACPILAQKARISATLLTFEDDPRRRPPLLPSPTLQLGHRVFELRVAETEIADEVPFLR